jgi:DNA-binding HxlR family transcriptional regulator
MLVLWTLARTGALRSDAVKDMIEQISMQRLAQTLRRLEQDGFLSRTVYLTNPPYAEYALTLLGESLVEPLRELVRWAKHNRGHVVDARRRWARRNANGRSSSSSQEITTGPNVRIRR